MRTSASAVIVLNEAEEKEAARHEFHTTHDLTTFSSVREVRWCATCNLRYTTGKIVGYYGGEDVRN